MLALAGVLLVSGCGSKDFKNDPRPNAAQSLTGVITNKGVTISPSKLKAQGPVLITISNQTKDSHTVTLEGDSVRETVGPINPMDTATIQKTLTEGSYELKAGSERAVSRELPAGALRIGAGKSDSSNQLLLP